MDNRSITIRQTNDLARRAMGVGSKLLVTQGVRALGDEHWRNILEEVENFNNFNPDNDPYGEHDFGSIDYNNNGTAVKVFWKIDYYNRDFNCGEDPLSPNCRRVITVMLAEEY